MAGDIKLPNMKARVEVDSKGVDAGLDRIQASTRNTGTGFDGLRSKAGGAIDSMSSSLTSQLGPAAGVADAALAKLKTTGSLMGPAIAGGAALAGVAVAAFALDGARKFVGLADEIRNFQRASGASAEDSSRFVAVLDDMGISSEVGAKAIFKLNREIGEGGKNLAKYGVEVARAKDGTVDTTGTLLNLADAYAKTSDPGQRAAMVMSTLGKQGQALIPVLEQGRAGLAAFFEGAESGRQIFSQADLDKARAYELAMDDLSDTFRGFKLEAGSALLPFLTTLAEGATAVLGFTRSVGDLLDKLRLTDERPLFAGHVEVLEQLKAKSDAANPSQSDLKDKVKELGEAQQQAAAAADEQAKAIDRVAMASLSALSSQVSYEASVNTLKDNINDLDGRTRAYTDAVNTSGVASKEAEAANRALRDAHLGIEESALRVAGAALRLAEDTATAEGRTLSAAEKTNIFRGALNEMAAQADGPSRAAIEGLSGSIRAVPDSKDIPITVEDYASAEADHIRRSINAIPDRKAVHISVDKVGGGDFPERAHGGPVTAHRPYIVGEKRPELFVPEVNGRIIPRVPAAHSPGSASATAGSAAPPAVYTTIVMDRKVLASAVSQGQYEARRR